MTMDTAAKRVSRPRKAARPTGAAAEAGSVAPTAAGEESGEARRAREAGAVARKAEPLTLQTAARVSADVRTLAVNVTVLLIILIIAPAVLTQFLRTQIVIDPIAVPAAMQADGMTPEVVARRLWDGLQEVKASAGTSKNTFSAIPDSEQIDFSIPDAGLSIDSLVYYVRRFFNIYETRIGGEFRCADPACTPEGISLRLRVVDKELKVVALPPRGERTESEYMTLAATEVMNELDPFVAIAARAKTEPGRAKAELYQLIARRHPDAKWAHNLIGNLLLDDDKVDAAMREFRSALALDPGFYLARTNLGRALWMTGDLTAARAAYDEVLRANPRYTFAIEGLADLALSGGKVDEALRLLRDAARDNPLETRLLLKAATIEYRIGRYEDAVENLSEVLRIEPTNTTALLLLALHYQINDRYAEAAELYGAAVDFDPWNVQAAMDHSAILFILQRFNEAAAEARRVIAIDPGVVRARILLAQALFSLDRPLEALDELKVAETLAPNDPEVAYQMGPVYAALSRWDEAIAAFRRFMALDPESLMVQFAEIMIGKWEESRAAAAITGPGA
jgi:tetratricopeptide (TPR) repeat protein